MLHKDPYLIAPETFELIVRLQKEPELDQFYLVGGTSLALQLGHRNSIDIDLFTTSEFENSILIDHLAAEGIKIDIKLNVKNTIIGFLNGIKVDFVRHNYPLINEPITEEGVTMLSLQDIAAMKIHAITNSGKRLKDFVDIYYLLERFCMEELVECYTHKYTNFNPMIALRALSYFDDIDPDIDPPKMQKPLPIEKITSRIKDAVLHPKKTYE